MPFTVSHVAAVLPARGVRLRAFVDFPALAVGAMAPDASYVLALFGPYFEAHTLTGLVTVAWPMALVGYAAYRLCERPWRRLLPWLADGARPWRPLPVLLGTLVGASTHLFWDAFTHKDGDFVELWPALSAWVALPLGASAPVYHLLQHASSAFGLAALAVAVHRSLRRRQLPFTASPRTLAGIVTVLVVTWLLLLAAPLSGRPQSSLDTAIVVAAFRGLLAGALVFVGFGLFGRKKNVAP